MTRIKAAEVRDGQKFMYHGRIMQMATQGEWRAHAARPLAMARMREGQPVMLCWCDGNVPASILADERVWIQCQR